MSLGWIESAGSAVAFSGAELAAAVERIREPAHVLRGSRGHLGLAFGGRLGEGGRFEHVATLPAMYPEWLGERSFAERHGARFPYVVGEMANGIATARMVIAAAEAGLVGMFGAAGLAHERVAAAIDEIQRALGDRRNWGVNLIHTPGEPAEEEALVDLLIRRAVPIVSASAFMGLTPALVRASAHGLHRDATGRIQRRRAVFAKISRPETAQHFIQPPPAKLLAELVSRGLLSAEEAELAALLPIAEDITVEADSGGHTDNRPLAVVLPLIAQLRGGIAAARSYPWPIRVGAAGGLGTPTSVASAFALGSAYVLTGSINQAAIESGLSELGRTMLAKADVSDVAMAPSADMFEIGAKVQVLKRGTFFAARGTRLFDAYTRYGALAELPGELAERLEREVFQRPLSEALAETRRYWASRDPAQLARAQEDPKHEMALLFRSYLGLASQWAVAGEAARAQDFQIWCGPAMGAFNRWAAGSSLEAPASRTVVQIALNLLEGAAVVTRAQQLRSYGVAVPEAAFDYRPRPLA
ncbi:MAG: PfaD family polyunsaturated fatty acid/polyketide biosynthesis protein [Myxococcota bacterium]